MRHRRRGFRLWLLGHHSLGGDEETSNRRGILQSRADDLGWVDDALFYEIAIFAGLGVIAEGIISRIEDLAGDHRAVLARILSNLAGGRLQRSPYDIDANLLVVISVLEAVKRLQRPH